MLALTWKMMTVVRETNANLQAFQEAMKRRVLWLRCCGAGIREANGEATPKPPVVLRFVGIAAACGRAFGTHVQQILQTNANV